LRYLLHLQLVAALTALYIVACSSTLHAAEHNKSYIPIRALAHIDVTDTDMARVEEAVGTIPHQIQKQIAGAGIEIVLTPQITFDEPENSGKKFFRDGGTAENLGGVFESRKHRVAIPEKASWRNSPPRPQGKYIISVCRHEIGHAWDFSLEGHSRTQAYIDAYDEDFKKLTNEQCRKWAYYITGISTADANVPTASGRGECFASVFAALVTPQSELTPKANDLLQTFPHVARNLQGLDGELGHVLNAKLEKNSTQTTSHNESQPCSPQDKAESSTHVETAKQFLADKKFEKAVSQLNWATKLNPNNSEAFLLRGNAFSWMTKYRLAIRDYTTAIKLSPASKDAYEMRARAHGWLGEARLKNEDEARAKGGN
jgi:tetratricopeptide (TPR) repeat protein